MVVPKDFTLPQEHELTVQEVNVTYPSLHAASFYIGAECENQSNEFYLCKKELKDPRKCLEEGKMITACALKVFQRIKKHCAQEFKQYANCLEWSSGKLEYKYCRKTQAVLDDCVLKNLNIERPPPGYFCEPKIHDTPRPKPPASDQYPRPYPDAVPRKRPPLENFEDEAGYPRHAYF